MFLWFPFKPSKKGTLRNVRPKSRGTVSSGGGILQRCGFQLWCRLNNRPKKATQAPCSIQARLPSSELACWFAEPRDHWLGDLNSYMEKPIPEHLQTKLPATSWREADFKAVGWPFPDLRTSKLPQEFTCGQRKAMRACGCKIWTRAVDRGQALV